MNWRTKWSIRFSIWACSDFETACGGVFSSCGPESGNSTRFITQHQIGIVFESASGMPKPLHKQPHTRICSPQFYLDFTYSCPSLSNPQPRTYLALSIRSNKFSYKSRTYPPDFPTKSKTCRLTLLKLNPHSPVCPSVLLKYTLSAFCSGGIYQLPH